MKEKQELRRMYDMEGVTRREKIYSRGDIRRLPLRLLFGFTMGTDYFMRRKINTAIKLGRFPVGSKVVEVGCMVGHYSLYMQKLGYRMTGVDLSEESIKTARLIAKDLGMKEIEFHACDVERLTDELGENIYDGLFSFSTLRYLNEPQEAINQIFRVLKPGGNAVCDFPNIRCPWFKTMKSIAGIKPHIHDNLYTRGQIEQLFINAGFEDVRSEVVMFSHKAIPAATLPLFMMLDSVLENLPLTNEMGAIIMCRGSKPNN